MQEENEDERYDETYDDPYLILAYHIVCSNNVPTIKRFLKDYKFVKRVIVRETKDLDLHGPFLDCLSVAIREENQKARLASQLEALGGFFYNRLDLNRMRKSIRKVCNKLGMGDLIEEE